MFMREWQDMFLAGKELYLSKETYRSLLKHTILFLFHQFVRNRTHTVARSKLHSDKFYCGSGLEYKKNKDFLWLFQNKTDSPFTFVSVPAYNCMTW